MEQTRSMLAVLLFLVCACTYDSVNGCKCFAPVSVQNSICDGDFVAKVAITEDLGTQQDPDTYIPFATYNVEVLELYSSGPISASEGEELMVKLLPCHVDFARPSDVGSEHLLIGLSGDDDEDLRAIKMSSWNDSVSSSIKINLEREVYQKHCDCKVQLDVDVGSGYSIHNCEYTFDTRTYPKRERCKPTGPTCKNLNTGICKKRRKNGPCRWARNC